MIEIRTSLVLINLTFTCESARARNIFSPTPVCVRKPIPETDSLAISTCWLTFAPGHWLMAPWVAATLFSSASRFPPSQLSTNSRTALRLSTSSTNGVNDHLRALERKGYLRREDMKSRALRPTDGLPESQSVVADDDDENLIELPILGRVAAGPLGLTNAFDSPSDTVRIDLNNRKVDVVLPAGELEARRAAWKKPELRSQTPWEEIYRSMVGQMGTGACLEPATLYLNVIETRGESRNNH